jgi:ribose transport system permease protein
VSDSPAGTPVADPHAAPRVAATAPGLAARGQRLASASVRKASAVYVFAAIVLIFAFWVPDTFLTSTTWKTLLDDQALTAMVAVGLALPLAAGVFDLAVGSELGLGAILIAWLLASAGLPIWLSVVLTVLAGAVIGLANGLLIVKLRIDSFIATIGMSSILVAAINWISGGSQILNLSQEFQNLATTEVLGITLPVYIMIVVAAVVFYVLECSTVGRRIYATGGNAVAARLAGVHTSAVIVGTLVASGAIAAGGGLLLTASLGTGDPTVGPAYLLPTFAAAFLGSTQFKSGRFNVWGTVVAVYVLATGVKGLQLAGAPVWIPDLFNGGALIVAVGMAKYQGVHRETASIRRMLRMRTSEDARS